MSYFSGNKGERLIGCINDNTTIGYKYLKFHGETELSLSAKCDGEGIFEVYTDGNKIGEMEYNNCMEWTRKSVKFVADGVKELQFKFRGDGVAEVLDFSLTA